MRFILLILAPAAFILLSSKSCKTGYETYQKTEGVTFGYKWGEAKNEVGEKAPALMLLVDNENTCPITYRMSVDFYYEGILRESGSLANCVPPGKVRKGKLNGVYLISEEFTSEQLNSGDFKLELNDIEVAPAEGCDQES